MSYGILEQTVLDGEANAGDPRHEHELKTNRISQIAFELEQLARVLDSNKSYIGDLPADKARQLADRVRKL